MLSRACSAREAPLRYPVALCSPGPTGPNRFLGPRRPPHLSLPPRKISWAGMADVDCRRRMAERPEDSMRSDAIIGT